MPTGPEDHPGLGEQPEGQVFLAQHRRTRDPGVEGADQALTSLPSAAWQ